MTPNKQMTPLNDNKFSNYPNLFAKDKKEDV